MMKHCFWRDGKMNNALKVAVLDVLHGRDRVMAHIFLANLFLSAFWIIAVFIGAAWFIGGTKVRALGLGVSLFSLVMLYVCVKKCFGYSKFVQNRDSIQESVLDAQK
jgi:hypothetical protein